MKKCRHSLPWSLCVNVCELSRSIEFPFWLKRDAYLDWIPCVLPTQIRKRELFVSFKVLLRFLSSFLLSVSHLAYLSTDEWVSETVSASMFCFVWWVCSPPHHHPILYSSSPKTFLSIPSLLDIYLCVICIWGRSNLHSCSYPAHLPSSCHHYHAIEWGRQVYRQDTPLVFVRFTLLFTGDGQFFLLFLVEGTLPPFTQCVVGCKDE